MYSFINLGEPLWAQEEGDYPYISALYPKEKEQLALAANPAGGEIEAGSEVILVSNVAEAQIYYTLDGSEPTIESTLYASPIVINESCTLKAVAVLDGYEDSGVLTESYTVKNNSSGIKGDVNGDGKVDVADIATIISIMAGNQK